MSKVKVNPVMESDAMSADDAKQMDQMREADNQPNGIDNYKDDPEPAREATPVPDALAEEEAAPEKIKTVPHEALEAERQRRKAAEKEANELKLEQARISERLRLYNEFAQQQGPKKEEAPDPDRDALGALKSNAEEIRMLKAFKEQMENNQRQSAQIAHISNNAATLERQFLTENPDYNDASNYLLQSRRSELAALGFNDQQAQAQIMRETLEMANQSMSSGQNPAELIYKIAQLRGYAKKDTAKPQETIARIAEGQRANQSLSNVSGSSVRTNSPVSAKDLANMSEAQFAKMLKGMDSEQMKHIFGA